jgi:transcriptional regulator with XRE-family HTH domain
MKGRSLLRSLRVHDGSSQGDIGRRMNPPRSAAWVCLVERGRLIPNAQLVYSLAEALRVDASVVLGEVCHADRIP